MMTFDDLHRDLECDCLAFDGLAQNTVDIFARRVNGNPPVLADFASHHERGIKSKSEDCESLCKYRGVSMNKVDAATEARLRTQWAEFVRIKPRSPRLFCKFKLKDDAGQVWETPTNDPSHHTLLKSDQFQIELIEVLEVLPL